MSVTEGVDVQNVDVGRREEKVLEEGGGHVPRIEKDDGNDEVENVSRCHRHDQGEKELVCEKIGKGESFLFNLGLNGLYSDENSGKHEVAVGILVSNQIVARRKLTKISRHEDCPKVNLGHVKLV